MKNANELFKNGSCFARIKATGSCGTSRILLPFNAREKGMEGLTVDGASWLLVPTSADGSDPLGPFHVFEMRGGSVKTDRLLVGNTERDISYILKDLEYGGEGARTRSAHSSLLRGPRGVRGPYALMIAPMPDLYFSLVSGF